MAFDSAVYSNSPAQAISTASLIDAADDLCPVWAAQNLDRALAFLYVAPRDCAAVDVVAAH